MTIDAYPLAWPVGWPRTPAHRQARAKFHATGYADANGWRRKQDLSVHEATRRLQIELERLGAQPSSVVISTNVELRNDGLPRSGRRAPEDPGVAVYWDIPGEGPGCMAIDRYDRVADNIAAVAATVDALRAISRHGGAQILKRAFQGFKQLPGAGATSATMDVHTAWATLIRFSGLNAGERIFVDARNLYRRAMSGTHPDRGGNTDHFQLVQSAGAVLGAHFGEKL